MRRFCKLAFVVVATAAGSVLGPGCSSGGGGGSSVGSSGFQLEGAFYARGLEEGTGYRLVSPLSTVESDPITGLVVPGTLRPLGDGVEIDELLTMGLGPQFTPVVVPRNAVIVLRFSEAIDPSSVVGDTIDEDGQVVEDGSVRIRDQSGNPVAVDLQVLGQELRINPVLPGSVGLPPSPLVFNADGVAVADPTGFLRLVLPRQGNTVLQSGGGARLQPRSDGLGDPKTPIGFNPGNAKLDFIERNNLFPSNRTFNGFLPDVNPPRIVREYSVAGTFSPADGDSASSSSLTLHEGSFDTAANAGKGEWANRQLILRPETKNAEAHVVTLNTADTVVIAGSFGSPPRAGDRWRLVRAEFFEPDVTDPINPEIFDPDNPQNPNNTKLKNFVWFEEIDASGQYADANGDGKVRYGVDEKVPSRSVLKIRFNEPMDRASFLPYESFRVTEVPEPGESGFEFVGRIESEEGGLVMAYWPSRVNQRDESLTEYQGFGSEPEASRMFAIRAVPERTFLEEKLTPGQLTAFLDEGYRGVTDLGGLPLAFANSDFSAQKIFIEYTTTFVFETIPGQLYSTTGAIVHRFQGRPETGNDPFTGEPGVGFHDQNPEWSHVEGLYGPVLADINLRVNGVLAPAAVAFFTRVLDDAQGNRPPGNQFNPWPAGVGAPIGGTTLNGRTYASIYGARFQHVYRVEDCSVSPFGDLAGSVFDLYRVSFAPIGGNVTHDVYEDISIHAAHTTVYPLTGSSNGVPDDQFSGLGSAFDTATWQDPTKPCGSSVQKRANYIDPLETVVFPGRTWLIDQTNLFSYPGSPHAYHAWPQFDVRFKYNNQQSMMLEYRIRPQETAISFMNGFTFSPAILSAPFPRFRVYSYGNNNNILQPDPSGGDIRAKCAVGPQPKPQKFGDNSRYFYSFDYVKTTSTIRSPFIMVRKTSDPSFLDAIVSPPPAEWPPGTSVVLEFRAAEDPIVYRDTPEDGWTTKIGTLDGFDWIQFRVQVEGNQETLLVPTFDSVVIPYYR